MKINLKKIAFCNYVKTIAIIFFWIPIFAIIDFFKNLKNKLK
jgi:hypothetical protein